MAEIVGRTALEEALADYAPAERETLAKAFLSGLSMDELLFLAGFFGSSILLGSATKMETWEAISYRANTFRCDVESRQGDDDDHKLVLVSEFAACCGSIVRLL